MKLNSTTVTVILSIIIILALVFFIAVGPRKGASTTGAELIPFAQCVADSGTKFYGAFWCPHCQATKALFGQAVEYLPYIECSTPDMQGQTKICIDKGIKSYPTWVFPDGTEKVGELTLHDLASSTACALPVATSATSSVQ